MWDMVLTIQSVKFNIIGSSHPWRRQMCKHEHFNGFSDENPVHSSAKDGARLKCVIENNQNANESKQKGQFTPKSKSWVLQHLIERQFKNDEATCKTWFNSKKTIFVWHCNKR